MQYPFSGLIVRYGLHPNSISQPVCDGAIRNQLHINIWEIADNYFIDVGVMIESRGEVEKIQVDLPWLVHRHNVSDLGSRLNGEKSVAAVFNEIVHYDGYAEGNFANISFRKNGVEEETTPFCLLRLNSQFFDVQPVYLGDGVISSKIIVDIPQPPTTDGSIKAAYIRFRIRDVPRDVYTQIFKQRDQGLISSSVETRIIDFRINERRGVPDELLSNNHKMEFPVFEKIHCFITIDRQQDCISHSKNYQGFRSLFDEIIWNEYIRLEAAQGVANKNSVRNYLGHQWTASPNPKKNSKGVTELVVLGRFSRNISGVSQSIMFVILGLIFGAAGNGVWDFLTSGFASDCKEGFMVCSTASESSFVIGLLSAAAFILIFFRTTTASKYLDKTWRAFCRLVVKVKN